MESGATAFPAAPRRPQESPAPRQKLYVTYLGHMGLVWHTSAPVRRSPAELWRIDLYACVQLHRPFVELFAHPRDPRQRAALEGV